MITENRKYSWVLFFVSPLAALGVSLKQWKSPHAKNILWAFIIFVGLTMTFSSEGQDAERYIANLEDIHDNINGISQLLQYVSDNGYADFVQVFLTYLVSIFTSQSTVLFAVFGTFFGFFYSRNIFFVLSKCSEDLDGIVVLLIVVFSMIVGVWMINGFRFWSATHVYFYGVLHLLGRDKRIGYFALLLSVITHFSFVLPVLLVVGFKFLPKKVSIYWIFFVLTFFINNLEISMVRNVISMLPVAFEDKASVYVKDAVLDKFSNRENTFNWYIRWAPIVLKYFILISTFFITRNLRRLTTDQKKILAFSLFFAGVSNLVALLPSGGRFLTVANLFLMTNIIWFFNQKQGSKAFVTFVKVYVPGLVFYLLVVSRYLLGSFSLATIGGNPIIASVFYLDESLIEWVKSVL